MKLKFNSPFKSILSFPNLEIDQKFVLITGKNGAGKTHLLEAIERKHIGLTIEDRQSDKLLIQRFHHSTILSTHHESMHKNRVRKEREAVVDQLQGNLKSYRERVIRELKSGGVSNDVLDGIDAQMPLEKARIVEILEDAKRSDPTKKKVLDIFDAANRDIKFPGRKNPFIEELTKNNSQKENEILAYSEEEIDDALPVDWYPKDIFHQHFAYLFAGYDLLMEENNYKRYRSSQFGEKVSWLSEDEFLEKHGDPPWEIVNRIFEESDLPLKVNMPQGDRNEEFKLKLSHKLTGKEFVYNDLSSGEKVIISLTHCLFYKFVDDRSYKIPDVLLLDEPDAPLHPSLTSTFLDVVIRVLVEELGVTVIMTTHSPSTISLSPVDSIYRLEVSPRKLIKSSKESAISLLTDGLQVILPSTKIVVVEAKNDETSYKKIFEAISKTVDGSESSKLVFLRASNEDDSRDGGCMQVLNWVPKLSELGIPTMRGLIDWDGKNQDHESAIVKVLRRYSIENYLLDPLLLYSCLLEKGLHSAILEIDELSDLNVHRIPELSNENLQKIVDAFQSYFRMKNGEDGIFNTRETFEISYLSKQKVAAPVWLKTVRGHDLEKAILAILKNDFGTSPISSAFKEPLLMLSQKLPSLVPCDLVEIFSQLSE